MLIQAAMNSANIAKRRLVRKKELLEIIPIGLRTLDSYIAKRVVPYLKIGGVVLFDVDEVVEALKKFKRKANTR
jgi:hypothetical protein